MEPSSYFSPNFEIAFYNTKGHEGGYRSAELAKQLKDKGGETYMGVSRVSHPDWPGWKIIDEYRVGHKLNYNKTIDGNPDLDYQVKDFYKKEFWDKQNLDQVKDPDTASMLFDVAVNHGNRRMVDFVRENLPQDEKVDSGKTAEKTGQYVTELNADQIKRINEDGSLHDKIINTRESFIDRNLSKKKDYVGLKKRAQENLKSKLKEKRETNEARKMRLEKKLIELQEKGHHLASHQHMGHVCSGADCTNILHNISNAIEQLKQNIS